MARKGGKRSQRQSEPDPELDEVDAFAEEQEKVLLDQSGYSNRNEEESSDDEQEVLDIGENESEDEEREVQKYRNKLAGNVDEEDEEYFEGEAESDDEDEEGWGRSEYYGADEVENDEEVQLLEEEALRQQKKHLEELSMEDYMVDEMVDDWKSESSSKTEDKVESSEAIDFSKLDDEGKLSILKSVYPEFLPLTKELNSLKPLLEEYKSKLNEGNEIAQIKYTALSTYLGTIGTYFAIFVGNLNSGEQISMKDEPIMGGILSTREIWRQAKSLPDVLPEISESSDEEIKSMNLSDDGEVESDSDEDMDDIEDDSEEEEDNDSEDVEEEEIDFSKKRNLKKSKSKGFEDTDEIDIEDKRGRRKTLRFYTSKIDQQENKKDAKFQGDQDLPYKERLFEKQQRLLEEAKKRGDRNNVGAPGVDLADNNGLAEYDFESRGPAKSTEDEDYYNMIMNKKQSGKDARHAAHEAAVKAAKEGKLAELEQDVDSNGKRAVNYQIMKNKGLTPHRKKDNRNSRVKKRKKFAKAQIKLKSVRAVYQGQQGPYGGEATGIKKNLSRSVKLV